MGPELGGDGSQDSSCLTVELGRWSFPAFRLELKRWLFLGLEPAASWNGTPPSAPLGLQLADCSSRTCQPL